MRSSDGGKSWQDHRPGAQPDVHSLAWHPRARGRAYEAGGGGAAFSTDAGETWRPADEGRDRHYTWSVGVDPDDAERWYVSASTGPYAAHGRGDPQARIYRRRDGESWQPLSGELPEPLPAMPYALLATEGRVFAGLANGQLWESRDRGDSWTAMRLQGGTLAAVLALALASDPSRQRLREAPDASVALQQPSTSRGHTRAGVAQFKARWGVGRGARLAFCRSGAPEDIAVAIDVLAAAPSGRALPFFRAGGYRL